MPERLEGSVEDKPQRRGTRPEVFALIPSPREIIRTGALPTRDELLLDAFQPNSRGISVHSIANRNLDITDLAPLHGTGLTTRDNNEYSEKSVDDFTYAYSCAGCRDYRAFDPSQGVTERIDSVKPALSNQTFELIDLTALSGAGLRMEGSRRERTVDDYTCRLGCANSRFPMC